MFGRFKLLNARQQVAIVTAMVALVCVGLIAVWFLFLRVPYRVLFAELRSSDAAAIIAELDRKKIPYRLADGGATILVPSDVADRTRLSVMNDDVPLKGNVGFELFDRSDMGLTDFAQKINYQRALQGELERTIASLDGVDSARVHLSLGEQRIFRDDQVPPKASVTVRMQRGLTLAVGVAAGIAKLIAAAVPNLDPDNVVVLDERGRTIDFASPAQTSAVAAGSSTDEERRALENYYLVRVHEALERAFPLVNETVAVVAGSSQSPVSLTDWSPSTRSFPLIVTVLAPAALDGVTRDGLRNAVDDAIGYDPSKNDVIELRTEETANVPTPGARDKPFSPMIPPAAAGPDTTLSLATISLFLAFVTVAAAFLWRLRRPKRLSESQRSALANKFRDLLTDGDNHAVP